MCKFTHGQSRSSIQILSLVWICKRITMLRTWSLDCVILCDHAPKKHCLRIQPRRSRRKSRTWDARFPNLWLFGLSSYFCIPNRNSGGPSPRYSRRRGHLLRANQTKLYWKRVVVLENKFCLSYQDIDQAGDARFDEMGKPLGKLLQGVQSHLTGTWQCEQRVCARESVPISWPRHYGVVRQHQGSRTLALSMKPSLWKRLRKNLKFTFWPLFVEYHTYIWSTKFR